MSHYSTGCLDFFYDQQSDVVYRTLDFLGFPIYRIGTDGSLWSRHNSNKGLRSNWKRLNGHPDQAGYPCIRLHCNNTHKAYRFHQLVLWSFHGPKATGMVCRHLNGKPGDNRVENVCWGTYKENRSDTVMHGTDDRGEKSSRAKLTEKEVREIHEVYARGKHTLLEIAKNKNVSIGAVLHIVNGKSWKHLGLTPINRGSLKGDKHRGVKLSSDAVREIKQLFSSGLSLYRIGQVFGVKSGTIQAIIEGRTWRHVT